MKLKIDQNILLIKKKLAKKNKVFITRSKDLDEENKK